MNIANLIRSILPASSQQTVVGPEILTDGGLEAWTTATDLTNWSEYKGGTGTVDREAVTKHGGSYSCKMTCDASANDVAISQVRWYYKGNRYRLSIWTYGASGKYTKFILGGYIGGVYYNAQPDGTWKKNGDAGWEYWTKTINGTGSWVNTVLDINAPPDDISGDLAIYNQNASTSIYIDDVSVKNLLNAGMVSCWVPGGGQRATDIIRGNHGQASGLAVPEVPPHGYCREILADGGLEVWTSATNLTNWTEGVSGSSTINREASVKHGGGYSCRMDVDSGNNYCFIDQYPTLEAGKRYRLSFWFKTAADKSVHSTLAIDIGGTYHWLQPDGTWKTDGEPGFGNFWSGSLTSTTWAKKTIDFYCLPEAVGTMTLRVQPDAAASSSIYIDDVSLLEFVETLGPELFPDGGVEVWNTATDLAYWDEYTSGTTTINREATTKHGGSYSCRFDVDALNSGAYIAETANLKPGSRYRLSMWYKTAAGKSAMFQFTDLGSHLFMDDDGKWYADGGVYVTLAASTAWKNVTIDFIAPDAYSVYAIYVNVLSAASSSFYVDDFSIKEIIPPPVETDLGWTFDGKTGGVLVADHQSLDAQECSIGAWVKMGVQAATWPVVLEKQNNYGLIINAAGGSVYFNCVISSTQYYRYFATNPSTTGWTFLVATYNKATGAISCYRNGVLDNGSASEPTPGTSLTPNAELLAIGNDHVLAAPLGGAVALPFLVNRPLSAQEIANIYNETKGLFHPRG